MAIEATPLQIMSVNYCFNQDDSLLLTDLSREQQCRKSFVHV